MKVAVCRAALYLLQCL